MTILLLTLAGTVISIIIGTLWYFPSTPMGKLQMRYLGFDKLSPEEQKAKMEKAKPRMPKLYAGQMVLSLLTSFATVFIVTMSMQNGLTFLMALVFVLFNWLCFMVPAIGSGIIWGNCEPKIVWLKFFSDSFSFLTNILVIAFMTSMFV